MSEIPVIPTFRKTACERIEERDDELEDERILELFGLAQATNLSHRENEQHDGC